MYRDFVKKVKDICTENAGKEFIRYFKEDGAEVKWTYGRFQTEVDQMVMQLKKGMIHKGDRVLLLAQSSPEAYRMLVALAVYGAVCVILDGEQPREEQEYLIEKSDIRAIMTSSVYYDRYVREYEEKYPVFDIESGCQFCEKAYFLEPTADCDEEVMAILYSSGTTSEPKGVMISYEGQLYSSRLLLQAFGTSDIRYLFIFPLFHISGFSVFLALFLGGGQIGLLENANSQKLLEGFQKYHPNTFGMIPKVYEAFQQKITEQMKGFLFLLKLSGVFRRYLHINIGKYLFRKVNRQVFGGELTYLAVGGGLVTKEVSDFFLKLGYRWMNTYAATEQNLPIAITTSLDNYPLNAVGKAERFPEIVIRIQNQDENGTGEIQVKSPCRMKGYFRDVDATEQAYEEGYFRTGDLGYIDSRGYLYVTGRNKESIHLPNGEKVSPERIELLYAPCIPENAVAACSGVSSEGKNYDDIVFFLEKKDALNEERVRQSILEYALKIGGNYRISRVVFIDKMPVSAIGKVQRYKLRNMGMAMETKTDEKKSSVGIEPGTYQKLKQILNQIDVKTDIGTDSALGPDLGLDSLKIFELCVEIENVFHVDVSDCISAQITIDELCRMIETDKDNRENTMGYNIGDFPLERGKGDKRIVSFIGRMTRMCYSFEAFGLENIPETGPYIICANHESHLDGMWIVIAAEGKIDLDQFCCMAKREHLKHRISRKGLRIMGGIPVDRRGNTSPVMKRTVECLRDGKIVLIHPEGTRTDNGKLGKLKAGVEKLALDAGVPVLPVRLEGAYEIFPKGRSLPHIWNRNKRGRYKLSVRFLPQLQPYHGMTEQLSHILGESHPSGLSV